MLHRGEGVDLLPDGQNDNAARVLAGATPNARTAGSEPLLLAAPLVDAVVLAVVEHISVGGLVCDRCDGARLEGLLMAEDDLRVGVGLGLVLAGEVEVDIRLLVSLEAKERLKGNVKARLYQRLPADRADPVRHIDAAPAHVGLDLFRIEVAVVALGAVVVRAQGIDLRDAGHRRDKGGADGAAGADQVPVLVGLPDELLRDDVHDGVAVLDDGSKLLLEPVLHDLRQGIPIHAVGLAEADLPELLVRVLNDGRALVRPHRGDRLDHVRDLIGVGDDDLLALVRAEVGKLVHHLIGRPKV